MTRPLIDAVDGLIASADERLSPGGEDIPHHYLLVARRLAEADARLARLDDPPDPFENRDPAVRASDAAYAVTEAALGFWGLAVRLRARFTGTHARAAAEPLRVGLRSLAAGDFDEAGPALLGHAARSLAFAAQAVELAEDEGRARAVGATMEPAVRQLVSVGVLSLLRVIVAVRDS